MDEDTFCGAVNSKVHYDKVMSYIKLAQEDPEATIHTGEGVTQLSLAPHNKDGFFIQPTIISGVGDDHRCDENSLVSKISHFTKKYFRCMQEEIFGPVTCVTVFDTEAEVVERVNNTRYSQIFSLPM